VCATCTVWQCAFTCRGVTRLCAHGDADGLCNDERRYYLGDANFNVTTLVDTVGDALERHLYEPYGKVTMYDGSWANVRSTSSYANVVLYTGRERDAETGLYHCRHRSLAAELGRFVGRDPVGYRGAEMNQYSDVRNSPIVSLDPTGEVFRRCMRGSLTGLSRQDAEKEVGPARRGSSLALCSFASLRDALREKLHGLPFRAFAINIHAAFLAAGYSCSAYRMILMPILAASSLIYPLHCSEAPLSSAQLMS